MFEGRKRKRGWLVAGLINQDNSRGMPRDYALKVLKDEEEPN